MRTDGLLTQNYAIIAAAGSGLLLAGAAATIGGCFLVEQHAVRKLANTLFCEAQEAERGGKMTQPSALDDRIIAQFKVCRFQRNRDRLADEVIKGIVKVRGGVSLPQQDQFLKLLNHQTVQDSKKLKTAIRRAAYRKLQSAVIQHAWYVVHSCYAGNKDDKEAAADRWQNEAKRSETIGFDQAYIQTVASRCGLEWGTAALSEAAKDRLTSITAIEKVFNGCDLKATI